MLVYEHLPLLHCVDVASVVSILHKGSSSLPFKTTKKTSRPRQDVSYKPDTLKAATHTKIAPTSYFRLLDLPAEIRLEIYQWVAIGHVISPPTPVPWTPIPPHTPTRYQTAILTPSANGTCHLLSCSCAKRAAVPCSTDKRRLCAARATHFMPSALLCASQQVYSEARLAGFVLSEFSFENALSSGVCAGAAFVAALPEWQQRALRYARVDMAARDGARLRDMGARCSGLWGLRLRIVVAGREEVDTHGLVAALRRMEGLRAVEVEVVGEEWCGRRKMQWVLDVETQLGEGRGRGRRVSLLCVEKVAEDS